MLSVVTPQEMAAIDAAAPESVEVLIGRAGGAVARTARRMLGGTYGRRVVVIAGKGNNGRDGWEAADRLDRWGAHVVVVAAADVADVRLPPADLVIDAAYGTGFRGEYQAPDTGGTPVLAVDIPSGVHGLTGVVSGRAAPAVRTVTFAALKPGLLFPPGRTLAGEIELADIGLDVSSARIGLVEAGDVGGWVPARPAGAHKWQAAVVVVAGSPGMTGAAHLAAAAAQRTGAGMVRLASPGVTDDPMRPTEAVGVPGCDGPGWDEVVAGQLDRARALLVGPGLGLAEDTVAAVRRLVGRAADVPLLVDGDGLTALGDGAAELLRGRATPAVLTPHDGEFARLAGAPPEADRIAAARDLAARTGSVVLLKGPTTVIAHPDGRARLSTAGDQRLATAGTGDVLSGAIAALLARGADPLDAAAAGAWLHGTAAMSGPADGLIARDVVDHLPSALTQAMSAAATAPAGEPVPTSSTPPAGSTTASEPGATQDHRTGATSPALGTAPEPSPSASDSGGPAPEDVRGAGSSPIPPGPRTGAQAYEAERRPDPALRPVPEAEPLLPQPAVPTENATPGRPGPGSPGPETASVRPVLPQPDPQTGDVHSGVVADALDPARPGSETGSREPGPGPGGKVLPQAGQVSSGDRGEESSGPDAEPPGAPGPGTQDQREPGEGRAGEEGAGT